jgi:hypothetical protein
VRTVSIPPMLFALAVPVTLALSCNSQDATQPSAADPGGPASPVAISETEAKLPPFDPDNFVRRVDHPLFPLPLGRRLIYRGTEDGEREKVVTDITRLKKTILGVPVVTVLDRVYLAGELIESTFDWYAQDRDGNVWYFGEDTKEFENGKVVSTAGSFEAGKHGAKAGIIMPAHPKLGVVTPQEIAPGVAEDKGKPVNLDMTTTVPYGSFLHCLRTEEFTPLEPGALETKVYCPGVGIARSRDVMGGTVKSELTEVIKR